MSSVDFMAKLLDGVAVEWKDLGDVIKLEKGRQLNKELLSEHGLYPAYNGGISHSGFTDTFNYTENKTIVSQGGASAGFVNFVTSKFYANAHCYVVLPNTETVANRYVYHLLKLNQERLTGKQHGAGIPALRNSEILEIPIPIPCPENPNKSLEIQAEIVRILDAFAVLTAVLTAELTAELTARKKQYNYYRDQLLSFEDGKVEWKTLGEVAIIGTGSHDTQDAIADGEYIFYARGREPFRLNEFDFDETAIITAGDGAGVGKVFHYAQGKYALHQRAYRIVPGAAMNSRFVFHCIKSHFYAYIQKASVSSSVTSLRRPMFLDFPIPVPSLNEQARIVAILDKFDALTESLTEGLPREIELRQKQYEHYLKLLLSFPQPEAIEA